MMTLEQVQAHLAERHYRPGWQLRAYLGDTTQLVMLQIEAEVENSYSPGSTVPLDIRWPIPPYALASPFALDKALSWRLQVELHESQEWYRKASRHDPDRLVPVFNPHIDGADRDEWPIVKRGG
jgi:hypothetical protein